MTDLPADLSADNLSLLANLSHGLTLEECAEFYSQIWEQRARRPGVAVTAEYLRAIHDAVTGQGVEFIEDGSSPTPEPECI